MSSFNVKANSGGGSELAPAGTHPAVLVAIVDLGTQDATYGDDVRKMRKVLLAWELVTEPMSGSKFNHVVTRDYTMSFGPKALLRGLIEKWRGRAFADNDEFDLAVLLGKPCLLTLISATTQKGKSYAKIDGVAPPMKGQAVPPPKRTPFAWSFADGRPFDGPDWLPYLYGRPVADVVKDADESRRVAHRSDVDESGEVVVDAEAAAEIPW